MKNQTDSIKVYILYARNTEVNTDLLSNKCLSVFPIEYRKRIKKFRRWQDMQASIIGRLLLSKGLDQFYNHELDFNSIQNDNHKRPFLLNSQIDFNISHSDGMVACAITEHCKIGIDIERVTEITVEDFFHQMTNFEYEEVMASENRNEEFFKYWTQKEAVIKAQGNGLYVPLKTFEIIKKETRLYNEKYYVNPIDLDMAYISHLASNKKIVTNEIFLTEVKL